jgi:acetylornithine deacetylase/succinyl-diaminopimelate desuccinylase-like protein
VSTLTQSATAVDLLRDLIRFDTSNPPGNERACLEYVAGFLAEHGIPSRFLARDADRPNLVARVRGRGLAPTLLFYGHVDVVPADPSEWTLPPFAGELSGGAVWGRGALDMKGGVAMMVSALARSASGPPPGDVLVVLTSDEETGSYFGMRFLVERHASEFDGIRHAISEVGGYTFAHGGRTLVPIQVAEKQRCVIRATVRGRGGHAAARVEGSASGKLGRLLAALAEYTLPVHVTPLARTVVDSLIEALPEPMSPVLRGCSFTRRLTGA